MAAEFLLFFNDNPPSSQCLSSTVSSLRAFLVFARLNLNLRAAHNSRVAAWDVRVEIVQKRVRILNEAWWFLECSRNERRIYLRKDRRHLSSTVWASTAFVCSRVDCRQPFVLVITIAQWNRPPCTECFIAALPELLLHANTKSLSLSILPNAQRSHASQQETVSFYFRLTTCIKERLVVKKSLFFFLLLHLVGRLRSKKPLESSPPPTSSLL